MRGHSARRAARRSSALCGPLCWLRNTNSLGHTKQLLAARPYHTCCTTLVDMLVDGSDALGWVPSGFDPPASSGAVSGFNTSASSRAFDDEVVFPDEAAPASFSAKSVVLRPQTSPHPTPRSMAGPVGTVAQSRSAACSTHVQCPVLTSPHPTPRSTAGPVGTAAQSRWAACSTDVPRRLRDHPTAATTCGRAGRWTASRACLRYARA